MALADALPHRRRTSFLERHAGELALGAAGIVVGGFALLYLKERTQEEAEHSVLESDGAFSVRRYSRLVTAEVRRNGALADAFDKGFRPLADYIGAHRQARRTDAGGRKIAMTVPVSIIPGDQSGAWTIRFVMPRAWTRAELPEPANGVVLGEIKPRTVAVVRFPGSHTNRELLTQKRDELLDWARKRALVTIGEPEFVAYNSPMVPPPLRRNEWWVEVQTKNPPA